MLSQYTPVLLLNIYRKLRFNGIVLEALDVVATHASTSTQYLW